MLRKYTLDPTHMVDWGELVVDEDGTFKEGSVCIMDSWGSSFAMQDCEASKGVVATSRSGVGNKGTRRHYVCQLSFPI